MPEVRQVVFELRWNFRSRYFL